MNVNILCNTYKIATGKVGRGVIVVVLFVTGISFYLGKVQWNPRSEDIHGNTIFMIFPHGVDSGGDIACISTWSGAVGVYSPYLLLVFPLTLLAMWCIHGFIPCTRANIRNALKAGRSIIISPDGNRMGYTFFLVATSSEMTRRLQ